MLRWLDLSQFRVADHVAQTAGSVGRDAADVRVQKLLTAAIGLRRAFELARVVFAEAELTDAAG